MLSEYTGAKKITARLAVIDNELVCKDSQTQNVEKLKAVLDEYLHVETLDANMLNQLIERIEITHLVNVDGCKQRNHKVSTASSERQTE